MKQIAPGDEMVHILQCSEHIHKFLPSKDVGMSFNLEKSLEHPMPILNQEHKFADPAPVTNNK